MKVALVGVGGMGGVHLDIYKGMADVELVALCDLRMDMLKTKAEGIGAKLYSDFDEMLAAEKPDVIDICTPTDLHAEMAIKAMEAGIHVLSEKPMALNGEDSDRLLEVINKTGKKYMTAQVVRFMNAYVYLRGLIENKKYGKLESLSMQRLSPTPMWSWDNWFIDEKRSGHVALDLMIHDVDFMQSVLGEPSDIVGIYHPMGDNYTNYALASYIYDGCTVSVESGWYNDQSFAFSVSFKAVFENGNLILKNGQLYENNEVVNFADTERIGRTGINISNVDGYAGEIRYFLDCIQNNLPSDKVTPESASATVKLIDRTLAALRRV